MTRFLKCMIPEKFQTSIPDKELVRVPGARGWQLREKEQKDTLKASVSKLKPTVKMLYYKYS